MTVRLSKAAIERLKVTYPGRREFKALEAPSRQETNDMKRAGWLRVEDGPPEVWAR